MSLLMPDSGLLFWMLVIFVVVLAVLAKWGFPVKLVTRRKDYDLQAREADVRILFYHWRRGARLGAHFVALRHTDRGFVGYNTYRTSTGADFYGPSLEAFLKKNGYFATTLVAIQNKGSCKE